MTDTPKPPERERGPNGEPLCFECGRPQSAHPNGDECARSPKEAALGMNETWARDYKRWLEEREGELAKAKADLEEAQRERDLARGAVRSYEVATDVKEANHQAVLRELADAERRAAAWKAVEGQLMADLEEALGLLERAAAGVPITDLHAEINDFTVNARRRLS